MCDTGLLAVSDIDHIEIVVAGESKHSGVWRICQVDCTLRLNREAGILLRSLHSFLSLACTGIHRKGSIVSVGSVISEHHLLIAKPFPCSRNTVELLRRHRVHRHNGDCKQ